MVIKTNNGTGSLTKNNLILGTINANLIKTIEFSLIEFYRIYKMYRICSRLFLVIFISFSKQLKMVFNKLYRFGIFYSIQFGKNSNDLIIEELAENTI